MLNTVITGTGSFIPEEKILNKDFIGNPFCLNDGSKIQDSNEKVIDKFKEITGIKERRYAKKEQNCSDLATIAAERAITSSGIDRESIDMIIVAQNFGDVSYGSIQSEMVPSIASRVKHNLGIKNEFCVPYDIIFGCPGWVQGMIQAHMFIQSGEVKRCLVIGSEVLSRVVDPFDRDTMIFADGAGATIVEGVEEDEKRGFLSHATISHTGVEKDFLGYGKSFNKFGDSAVKFIKMKGHKIYSYSLTQVPKAMKFCLDKANVDISEIKKILIHQANEKMDEAIVERLFKLYQLKNIPKDIMPMIIQRLGNSSVATVPTLLDLILKGELPNHKIDKDDILMFASVGAGMNINAITYKM